MAILKEKSLLDYPDLARLMEEVLESSIAKDISLEQACQSLFPELEKLISADDHTSDGFKNILFAMYKKYVYYTWHVPIFTEENEYVMNALEHIIKKLYGEWFLEHHRLNKDHWIFADTDGNYALCFTPHFIETVY